MKIRHVFRGCCLIPFVALGARIATSSQDQLIFHLDQAGFKYFQDSTVTYEEFYISGRRDQLAFRNEGGTYRADLEVTLEVSDATGEIRHRRTWKTGAQVNSLSETKRLSYLVDVSYALLSPGSYTAVVTIEDRENGKSGVIKREIDVPLYAGHHLMISELELASSITRSLYDGKFDKSGYRVIPNPTKGYGVGLPNLLIYGEIYNLTKEGSTYVQRCTILDRRRIIVKEYPPKRMKKPGSTSILVEELDVDSLPRGIYTLQVEVTDSIADQSAISEVEFLSVLPESPADERTDFPKTEDLYQRRRNEILYIATPQELKTYDALQPQGRGNFLQEFWRRRDPTPETPANEFLVEHYRRWNDANSRFTRFDQSGAAEGWKTDRGRVYIQYGPPEEVESHPFDDASGCGSWEKWLYYSSGGYEFVFGDLNGFGRYELMHSTAPKETPDYNWFRKLCQESGRGIGDRELFGE